MNKVKIITDSTSDLSRSLREQYDIDYLRMAFMLRSQSYVADLDWNKISPQEFYSAMNDGERIVTGLISAPETKEKFSHYLSLGYDILYIGCSCCLSGSVNLARIISSDFIDKYPNQKIVCFDSKRSNYAQGLMAIKASQLAQQGNDITQIVIFLYEERLKYQTYGIASSLSSFKKSGRVKTMASLMNKLAKSTAIIVSDASGYNYAYKACLSRHKAFSYLASLIKKRISQDNPTVIVEHADCAKEASELVSLIKEETGLEDVRLEYMGPIIGATVGSGFISLSFYGKKVTLSSEKAEEK